MRASQQVNEKGKPQGGNCAYNLPPIAMLRAFMEKTPKIPQKDGTKSASALIKDPQETRVFGRMPEAEIQTIRRAQAGEQEAFRELLETYRKPVFATLYRFLGNRFAEELEDLAQDVFVKVFQAIGRFDFDRQTKFSTWLYTCIRNYAVDTLKKRRIEAYSLSGKRRSDEEEKPFEIPGRGKTPQQTLGESELSRAIERSIGELPGDQREVFLFREYEGLDYGEIAEILRVSEGTVKSRLYRARDALRAKLSPYLRDGSAGALGPSIAEEGR